MNRFRMYFGSRVDKTSNVVDINNEEKKRFK